VRRIDAAALAATLVLGWHAPGTAQTIPEVYFPGLLLDEPMPTEVVSGKPFVLRGTVLDEDYEEVLFSFQPTSSGFDLDFYIDHLPGRFDRHIVFGHDQAGTYDLVVYTGALSEEFLEFQRRLPRFQVRQGAGPIHLPERFFDGLLLDSPLPTRLPIGSPIPFRGEVLDERISDMRFDIFRNDAFVSAQNLPFPGGRFDADLQLTTDMSGPIGIELVVGLFDGSFWARGGFEFEGVITAAPEAHLGLLSATLRSGSTVAVEVTNRGQSDLHLEASATPPFTIVSAPVSVAAGDTGRVVIDYGGDGGDEGELAIDTDEPQRPRWRVALQGVGASAEASQLPLLRADETGVIDASSPTSSRFALALFTPVLEQSQRFPFSVGAPPPAVSPAPVQRVLTDRQRGEAIRAHRAARLADRVRQQGLPAARRAQVSYAVGDERTFVFDEFGSVPQQEIDVRVVAVSERAVAFVHFGEEDVDLTTEQIEAHLARFDEDYQLLVDIFGQPSDVDGDGRVGLVYTPFVDRIGLGGFQDPDSILPQEVGGNGNNADLLFLAAYEAQRFYRPLIAHEFLHLINFHQHVVVREGDDEATWLDEGLAHVAEDFVDGFVDGNSAQLAQAFLANPSRVGLNAFGDVIDAERGAAYLFVRSLVDRFGVGVLARLVQTGQTDRANVESATGVPFRELMAGFATGLYTSGNDLGHSRFDYRYKGLVDAEGRAFPMPRVLRSGPDSTPNGIIQPRGVAFVEVTGTGASVESAPNAKLGAVLVPLPDAFSPVVHVPSDYFSDLHFDPPLPGQLSTGEPLVVRGHVADEAITGVIVQFEINGRYVVHFFASVDDHGRFERSLVLDHSMAGDLELVMFTESATDGEFLGTFEPVRVQRGAGPLHLPRGYFNGVTLDAPLTTQFTPGEAVGVSGTTADSLADRVVFEVGDTTGTDPFSVTLPVSQGRFAGALVLPATLAGERFLTLFVDDGDSLAYLGGFPITIGSPMTAVHDAGAELPERFELAAPYPNPFNAEVIVPVSLPQAADVRVDVYNLSGQQLAELVLGRLAPGIHRLRWDGRDDEGNLAASGVYMIRARAATWVATDKVLLLR
jgi:hypothetical protein